ncbi:MAG: hypothetical protein ABSB59_43095 [Streptosporangiaceae bacterium]|jgi:hypothetical protein
MTPAVCATSTRHNWANVSTPRAAVTGTLASAAKRARSAHIITGRFRRYSMPAPNGNAPAPTPLPAALTEYALHSHWKSRLHGSGFTGRWYPLARKSP